MKKTLFVLPILAFAGCSSNTAPVDMSTSSNATTSIPGTNTKSVDGVAVPFVRDPNALKTANVAEPNSVQPIPTATPIDTQENAAGVGAPNASAPNTKMPQVPPGMSMGTNMALTPTKTLDTQIAAFQKSGDKKKLAQSLAARGTLRMNDNNAAPRVKYRAALADYRAAQQADPTNLEAKTNAKLIESIYTSMGMPIPK